MVEIEVKLRAFASDYGWEQIEPQITYKVDEARATSPYVIRAIEAFFPVLALCEVRWNVKGLGQGHYLEYRRDLSGR